MDVLLLSHFAINQLTHYKASDIVWRLGYVTDTQFVGGRGGDRRYGAGSYMGYSMSDRQRVERTQDYRSNRYVRAISVCHSVLSHCCLIIIISLAKAHAILRIVLSPFMSIQCNDESPDTHTKLIHHRFPWPLPRFP